MTPRAIAAIMLLVLGVGVELACCVGVLVMRGVYDKLHYTAPATTVGAFAITGAVLLREATVQYGIKAILITLALLITNPVLSHAIARAARIRRHGAWAVRAEEEDEAVEFDVDRR
jgi:multicomponent Na+:H+ antiporter subunit G